MQSRDPFAFKCAAQGPGRYAPLETSPAWHERKASPDYSIVCGALSTGFIVADAVWDDLSDHGFDFFV